MSIEMICVEVSIGAVRPYYQTRYFTNILEAVECATQWYAAFLRIHDPENEYDEDQLFDLILRDGNVIVRKFTIDIKPAKELEGVI